MNFNLKKICIFSGWLQFLIFSIHFFFFSIDYFIFAYFLYLFFLFFSFQFRPKKCERKSQMGDTVAIHYTGTLEDGSTFDSSIARGQPFEFILGGGRVIPAFDQGLSGMWWKKNIILQVEMLFRCDLLLWKSCFHFWVCIRLEFNVF